MEFVTEMSALCMFLETPDNMTDKRCHWRVQSMQFAHNTRNNVAKFGPNFVVLTKGSRMRCVTISCGSKPFTMEEYLNVVCQSITLNHPLDPA